MFDMEPIEIFQVKNQGATLVAGLAIKSVEP